ncbi:MAG: hypothetical protein AOY29_13515 [Alcanivorax borkumensis]|jgi:AmpE protein|uniref:Inner membrane protein AmpE n=1 Tax=Alcanivorax borkumensis (strain ATCC 700651 / DSM 11573 / NCIMB 13689 / SK2) TaxID=393595 RepID=Q0VRX9_ALCBS|nr:MULTISPECIES: membrane protein [Alcanivorax]OJH07547.1 MAG: hypothetical protein AOY29_13515 [Alcanivorax borkumensis]CAL16069.1 inner membrane protein AmpE [Alcanivorax borkumensis SK2]
MKFIVLIVVMGLRRMDLGWSTLLADDERHQRWLQRCGSRIGQPARVWWVAVLLPAVLIAWAACWLSGFWGQLLVLGLGILLLLWLLGSYSEFRYVDELLVRGRMNDPDGFSALATDEFSVTGVPGDPAYHQQLNEQILAREERLFVAIFWLVLLGFGAAFLVVMNHAWLQHKRRHGREEDAPVWQQTLDNWLSLPPRQLLILSMALAGNFSAAMNRMRGSWWQLPPSASLLLSVAHVAQEESSEACPATLNIALDQLEALHGLLLRCVAIWLIVAALWIMLL